LYFLFLGGEITKNSLKIEYFHIYSWMRLKICLSLQMIRTEIPHGDEAKYKPYKIVQYGKKDITGQATKKVLIYCNRSGPVGFSLTR
jgi:hypothetical protein